MGDRDPDLLVDVEIRVREREQRLWAVGRVKAWPASNPVEASELVASMVLWLIDGSGAELELVSVFAARQLARRQPEPAS